MTLGLKIPLLKDRSFPYWKLSSVYFSNCLVLGALLPFWGLYLSSVGISESNIGINSAFMLSANIVAPFLWVKFSGKMHIRNAIRAGVSTAFLFSLLLIKASSFWLLSGLIFCICLNWQGINPLVESLTLSCLSHRSKYYGQIRLWGSIGFIFSVSMLGMLFDYVSISYLPYLFTILLLIMTLSVSVIPQPESDTYATNKGYREGSGIFDQRAWLFIGAFLLQVSEGAYVGFYSIYLSKAGHSTFAIGNLWAVAVTAEVLMFIVIYKFIGYLGAGKLLVTSYLITALRWLLIALFPDQLGILICAQLFHAFTFSAAHSSILELIKKSFSDEYQSKGILIYSGFSLAGGTALGAIISGYVSELNKNIFVLSSILACSAAFVILYWLKQNKLK